VRLKQRRGNLFASLFLCPQGGFCTLFVVLSSTTNKLNNMDKNNKKVEQHNQKSTHNSVAGHAAKSTQKSTTASTKSADKGCGTQKGGSCSTRGPGKQDGGIGRC
jgi:hypothetical protein